MTTERPRLRDVYMAYLRGETSFEELIRQSEARIAEQEQRARGDLSSGGQPAQP